MYTHAVPLSTHSHTRTMRVTRCFVLNMQMTGLRWDPLQQHQQTKGTPQELEQQQVSCTRGSRQTNGPGSIVCCQQQVYNCFQLHIETD